MLTIVLALAEATTPREPGPLAFDVPEGPATATLTEWSRQAHMQVLFDYNVMRPYSTPAVRGTFTIKESARRLVLGTPIAFDQVNPHTVAFLAEQVYCEPELGKDAPLPPCKQRRALLPVT